MKSDRFEAYLEKIKKVPPLSPDEERVKDLRLCTSWAEELNLPWLADARKAIAKSHVAGRGRWTAEQERWGHPNFEDLNHYQRVSTLKATRLEKTVAHASLDQIAHKANHNL